MPKLLIAESDVELSAQLFKQLRERGFEVFLASDAVEAPVVARKFQPDAVLINSRLAGGGGKAALKRIRCNAFTSNIPVLMVAAEGVAELIAAGAQECLMPPPTAEAVQVAVSRNELLSLDFTVAPLDEIARPSRLSVLRETSLLDTPAEESFDRLTRLTSGLLKAGTALVSLVDNDRQFFKSQIGLAEPWAGARQTRLSHSFCQWVVSSREELVVQNAHEYPALKNNLAVRDLGVVAYAGMPLTVGDEVIGSFCAIHASPRDWSEGDLEILRDLSRIGEAYATLNRARRIVKDPETKEDVSLHVAGKIILAAASLLTRCDQYLQSAQRLDLIAIIEEQGRHLSAMVPKAPV